MSVMLVTMTIGYSLHTDKLFLNGRANIKWDPALDSYTVIFNPNTGTGTMTPQTITVGETKNLTLNAFQKEGFNFIHWNTQPDGSGTNYIDGQAVKDIAERGDTITLYAQWTQMPVYTVEYNSNGGVGSMTPQLFEVGVAQNLKPNTFTKENRTFWHWNTQPDGKGTSYEDGELVNNLTNVPGDVVTLYAIYESMSYIHNGDIVFDGTNSINTDIYLFSEKNIDKNFEITFEISNVEPNQRNQATILNSMEEISPYPGFVFRIQTNGTSLEFNSPKIANKTNISITNTSKVRIERINGIYYIQINDGNVQQLGTYQYGRTFNVPVVLGTSLDAATSRFFKGTLSNIDIHLWESEKYTVVFDANGGTGTMANQIIRENETINLSANTFEREGWGFAGWNTKPDGSGTDYTDAQSVNNIALPNESVTLYAQWKQNHYSIRFNGNGGTGTMANQEFVYGTAQNINNNAFTKENSIFIKWNTAPDGSGTSYSNGQLVSDLTKTEGGIIDLYALWSAKSYSNSEYVFDGTNYIDTGMYLFEDGTINRDFEISFEIADQAANQNRQATFISAMDETGKPYPGIVYRYNVDTTDQQIGANVNDSIKVETNFGSDITKVNIKRTNGVLYIKLDDGDFQEVLNMSTMDKTFLVPLTFGASLNGNGSPQRQFKGTLINLHAEIKD